MWLLHHVATSKVKPNEIDADTNNQGFFVNNANRHILSLRKSIKLLYDYQFQVLPYVYTHMIGTATTMFLISYAIMKAFYFTPKAPISYGFVFPLFGLVFIVFSCVGLIDIGAALCNPFGGDAEDFAVFHFLNFTATSSVRHQALPDAFRSRRAVHYSPFTIHYSLFTIHRTSFTVYPLPPAARRPPAASIFHQRTHPRTPRAYPLNPRTQPHR